MFQTITVHKLFYQRNCDCMQWKSQQPISPDSGEIGWLKLPPIIHCSVKLLETIFLIQNHMVHQIQKAKVYIKETDAVQEVRYPAKLSTPEYSTGFSPLKQPCCSTFRPSSPSSYSASQRPLATTADVWLMGGAMCRPLLWMWWFWGTKVADELVLTCGSDTRLSTLSSSHRLPAKKEPHVIF